MKAEKKRERVDVLPKIDADLQIDPKWEAFWLREYDIAELLPTEPSEAITRLYNTQDEGQLEP